MIRKSTRQNSLTATCIIVALPVLLAGAACGSGEAETFTVRGVVVGSNDMTDGLAGASVSCAGTVSEVISGADGSFKLTCPVPPKALETDPATAAYVWFRTEGRAPLVKGLIPAAGETYAMTAVMTKTLVDSDVSIPSGNTSVPAITGTATLSFERDSMLDENGSPIVGSMPYAAASWDNSLPVELDEGTGIINQDALFPAWTRYVSAEGDEEQWLRPVAAFWFDPSPATINPEVGIDLQIFSQFANDVVERPLSGALDASLFQMIPDAPEALRIGEASLTATNQITAPVSQSGLWVWMVPQDEYACFNVTVRKGTRPVTGAQVSAIETFNGELERFLDETVGSTDGSYCVKAPSGRTVRINVVAVGGTSMLTSDKDVVSGGLATCGDACTPVAVTFPCEINVDCDAGQRCTEGSCVVPEAL
jgi:hypothetical protein